MVKFGTLEQTDGLSKLQNFHIDRFIESPLKYEKNLAVFLTSTFCGGAT